MQSDAERVVGCDGWTPATTALRRHPRMRYDAIVIGGGHNGLTAAAYLARAGPQGARARAPSRPRRRRGHRRSLSGLPVLGLLLRRLAAAAGDHPRPRPAAPRPRDPAARRHVHADAERRLPVARERSREDAARDRAALEARRRSVRRVRQGDGRDGALRQADPQHDAARSDVARSARADEAAVPRQRASAAWPTATGTTRSS